MTYQFQRSSQQAVPLQDVPVPEKKYLDWEIDSILGILYDKAIEIGEAHSQAHFQRTGQYAPYAHRASTGFKMVEIVRQLQAENAALQKQITDSGIWANSPQSRVKDGVEYGPATLQYIKPEDFPPVKRVKRVKKIDQSTDK
jgi:hypothetical protein